MLIIDELSPKSNENDPRKIGGHSRYNSRSLFVLPSTKDADEPYEPYPLLVALSAR